ncbi:transposase [Vibrio cholerae]|nr:transposase [Vibrio cholerae]
MLGFPVPYPNELIYSLVARAGVRSGTISPKQLLDEVYGDRKVIATVDLPSHLAQISGQYPSVLNITTASLIYQHTLFPIYAPFIEEGKRQAGMRWMVNQSKGLIHLVFGIAASIVKQPKLLRYCPQCFEEQLAQYGERYWMRAWQVSGATWCLKHSIPLSEFSIQPHYEHRHEFYAADTTPDDRPLRHHKRESLRISHVVKQLLQVEPQTSPTFYQWGCYYHDLVVLAGCNRGSNVKHDEVRERIHSFWSRGWLTDNQLTLTKRDTCWARTILRKHRKTFSFMQHLIIQSSLLDQDTSPSDILSNVKRYPQKQRNVHPVVLPKQINRDKRIQWLKLLKERGCKHARLHGSQGLYMWLYRL